MATSMEKVVDKPANTPLTGTNLRFERKFVFPKGDANNIIRRIQLNSFGFREVFHRRKINNIYFDDSNYTFYKQNVEGVANRKKIRLRWYGDTTSKIESPTIEIKKKIGEVGDKDSFKINGASTLNLDLLSPFDIYPFLLERVKQNRPLYETLQVLHPTLLNTYERRYFLSFCGRFRITIDYNQNFYNPNYPILQNSNTQIGEIVVELKYSTENDGDARQVSQQIGARLSKNSKYVTGINLLYHHV